MDSGFSLTIFMGKRIKKPNKKYITTKRQTQDGNFMNNEKVKINLYQP